MAGLGKFSRHLKGTLAFSAVFVMGLSACAFAKPDDTPDWSTLSSWAQEDVQRLYDMDILQSVYAHDFKENITRSEFCYTCNSVIAKWYDVPFDETKNIPQLRAIADQSTFKDFEDTNEWYIEFFAKLGIVNGLGDGRFNPNAEITREQAVVMLYNTLKVATNVLNSYKADGDVENGIYLPHVFADGLKVHNWSRNDIYAMYHLGVMLGDSQNNFDPQGSYTREQADCTFLRLYNAYKNPTENAAPEPELYPTPNTNLMKEDSSGRYFLWAAFDWGKDGYEYKPVYYDGFGNEYTAEQKGYVYPTTSKYMRVLSSMGTGSGRSTIIGKDGKEVIDGECDQVLYLDDEIAVYVKDGGCYKYNLETGEKTELPNVPGDLGCGMFKININGRSCYTNRNGEVILPYDYSSELEQTFSNDVGVLQKADDDSFVIVNTKGKALKSFTLDLDKYKVLSAYGTNMLLREKATGNDVLYRADCDEYITDYQRISFTDKGELIAIKEDDRQYLLNSDGSVKIYVSALGYDGIGAFSEYYLLYKYDLGDPTCTSYGIAKPYDLFDTDGNMLRKDVCAFDGEAASGLGLKDDINSGVKAYMSSNNIIVLFDNYGKDLGKIKTDEDIVDFCFINGLISVNTITQDGDSYISKSAYYTPTGKKAVVNATTQSIDKQLY
jgi:hypothetical protein